MSLTDRAKADLMGQARFLKDAYVSRGELHPDAAVFRCGRSERIEPTGRRILVARAAG